VKIIVLVKEVPDTYGDRTLDLETGLADRAASAQVLDEIGERAIEFAITYAGSNSGTEVVLLCMGPDSAPVNLRKGLAMGAHRAVHVQDGDLHGADLGLTGDTLAAAIRHIGFDVVIGGNLSTDGSAGVVPAMLAELLQVPQLTALTTVELSETQVSGTRISEYGVAQVTAPLPAVISITESLPDPRLPNFKGIMAAKKKPLETLNLADLGVVAESADVARSIMTTVAARPPRATGVKITDEGDAGAEIADFLVRNQLV
jgi:electron transfer flavoprotein beta subunit